MTSTVGYEIFVPAIAAALRGKVQEDDQLSESEFKQSVAVAFRDAVTEFMQDSLLYRVELPIDLYQDVKRYDLIPPDGYIIQDVVCLKEHKVNIPKHTYDHSSLYLSCCPNEDVDTALYVEVAIVPRVSAGLCEYDVDFIDRYYSVILVLMFANLTMMPARSWAALGVSDRYRRKYVVERNKARRMALNGGNPIKLIHKSLSSKR